MTKYKPLYALYKGLKEHGTDLPDSYGSFERSMTQAGDAGASNRRNFYQSLKDSNYDVPDTYEKFYESMFVPVNNTTSRARKIGETPMTEEDRKGFTLGAQDIRMNASKFVAGDALRYNKLKQKKQKQQKNFGRVNVGTNKTPYAPADNVVKDEGLNTYVTSDNGDTTNLDYAQQKQAVLDVQNKLYMDALDKGEIPMASETIDKNGLYDLQENIGKDGTEVTEEGLQDQWNAKLNYAYKRRDELNKELDAIRQKEGNALLSYSATFGDTSSQISDDHRTLDAAKRKVEEEIRNLEALTGKESSSFWTTLGYVANAIPILHNIKNGINYLFGSNTSRDMGKAVENSVGAAETWDFGLSSFDTYARLERIKAKIDNKIPLTKAEQSFAQNMMAADKSAQLVNDNMGRAYRWTSVAGVALPYMLDFFLTGGFSGMTKAAGKFAIKKAVQMELGTLGRTVTKYIGIGLGDVASSYAMAVTEQGLKTGADVMSRHLGSLYQDKDGNYAFGTFDENGNLLHEGGESFGKALYKGVTAAMLENYTEKMFTHWHLKRGAFKMMDNYPSLKKYADFFRHVGKSGWYGGSMNFMKKFGMGSYPEEVAEEIVNIPLNAALVGDNKFSELKDWKTWEDIVGSMAISVGSMAGMASAPHIVRGTVNQGVKAYDIAAFYVFKNRLNQADQRASEILGEDWERIKDRIDSAPNENLGTISADLHKQVAAGTFSEEQMDAAWAYIQNLRVMRGYNLAKTMEMQAKAMTGEENMPADIRQKQLNAAYAAGQETEGENKHLAQLEYEKQKFNLAKALGVSDSELEKMTDEQISYNLGMDDNLDNVIYNYQNSKAMYEGIVDNAQSAVDTAAKVASQRVDAMTNVEDGTIRQVLIKGTNGMKDYPVYIISGNVETHDDGVINYTDSDNMIIIYNETTGRKETIPVSMLADVNPNIQNAEEVKAKAILEAKQKTITDLSNVVDGKLVKGSEFTMEDAQGNTHGYKIEDVDELGNCIVSMDGTLIPEPMPLDTIQQQYDQSNVARSVKNDQTTQEPEQTQQESQPVEDKFDYGKITNKNDGKVKSVVVTDEEGKNRFPNAKAVFLIQDKGAMAKFVVMDEEGNLTSYVGKRGDKIQLSGEMTVDEYKKQRQEELQKIAAENANSSMIEDNSGTIEADRGGIEVEDNAQSLSEVDADNVIAQMESSAEVVPELELTPDNWVVEFGEDGIVSTPIGDVKMGENQVAKLFEKGRSKEFGMIKPTLTNPDVIIEVPSHSADGNEERSSSYLFIKTFLGKNGEKVYYFKSVTIRKDGLEISISSHYDRAKRVKEALMKGKLLYRNNDGAQTEQNQPSTSVTTSQEDAAGSSESKDTNISANSNENNESLTFEDGTPIPVDENGETDLSQTDAAHAAEWYDNNLGEDADVWLDGEIKKYKKLLEQAKNKKLTGNKPSELVASKKEKEAAIAKAQAVYNSAISIRDSLKERRIAKEENTPEGRKNLIEKARRKFARLKSALNNDAEAISQLYKETVGTLLHRLYDGTGIDVTDTIPLTAEEYVASNLGAHSLNYEGTETSKGVKQETGLSREDFAKTQLLAADGKGTTIDDLVHSLWENRPSNLESLNTQDIRNALIDVLTSGFKASEARNYVEKLRIAQAENFLEEQKKATDNAAFAEENKAESEQQTETAPESEEKPEVDAADSEKINEQTNENINAPEQNKFPDKLKVGSKTVEVPEDATDEKPLGEPLNESDLVFSPSGTVKIASSEERKVMIEKNAVRNEEVLDHTIGKKKRKALETVANMMGAKIVYLHSADQNGWYDGSSNTIYLALDSADVLGVQFIFGHEMTHDIKRRNPAAYYELKKLVFDTYGKKAFDKSVDATRKAYSNAGLSGHSRSYYAEEVVADAVGEMIRDLNLAHTLAMKMSHPLLAAIHEILQKIKMAFYGTEYSDVTKNIIRSIEQAYVKTGGKDGEILDGHRFSLKVYHGSGADFTEFDFDHMGEGEGSQAFGWGGYVSSSQKIGKNYAERSGRFNGLKEPSEIEKRLLEKAKSVNYDLSPYAAASLVDKAEQILREGFEDYEGTTSKDLIDFVVENAIVDNELVMDTLRLIKPEDIDMGIKNLYEVNIPDDNGSNYLDWDAPITDELIDKVAKALPSLSSFDIKDLKKDRTFDNFYKTISMRSVTDDASFNDDKAASKLLSSLGYTGIKYKAGRNFGGAEVGDTNYVIFKPEDMRITEHTKFSLKDIKPVGKNKFGDVYDQFKGKPKEAFDFLLENKDGYLKGVFHRDEIGDIDLGYGEAPTPYTGYGLAHIIRKHVELMNDFDSVDDAVNAIIDVISNGKVEPINKDRVYEINKDIYRVAIAKDENGNWVLSAMDKSRSKKQKLREKSKKGAATVVPPSLPSDGAGAVAPNLSAAKIDNSSETTKENGEKFSLKDEKIKSVAEKFGVNEDDVAMYANAVEKGSTAEAARARANIKRYLLQANEDKISSFKDIIKYTKPVNEALKENFGDLDAMIEERRKQVEAERNAMEAARKRAQEEEEKRQKHLEELSLIPTDELDKRYMDAIANNDESTAREMLDESARRNGYGDVDSDYQGQGAWAAPSNPQYESDEARRADIENSPDVNLEDIALGYNLQPDDYFDNPRAYMNNTAHGLESAHVIKNALDAIKNGEKDVKVKVYRAVPTSVKEGKLRNGDWVTPSKKYAEMHGDNRLDGKYRIIEDEVPANQLWWDGNDANEFGFDDGKEYRYKNAKNNRKLNDLITYDNKGNVIPPSKRFNSRKSDIRFSLAGERGAAAADKAEERTIRMDNLSVARKMEEEKKDAKAIKMATGWERGADGKWRYEMPDAMIKDTMDVGGGHIVKRYEDDMLWNGGKLSDVIDAPELFKAYPNLKDVRIETDAIMNDMPSNGEYNAKTNTITIHADELKYMNSILNHEIQHAIQYIEGFDRGGSPRLVRGEIKKRLVEVTKQIRQLRAEAKEDEAKAIVEKNRGLYNAYQANDDYNSYKSLAGEVEARNVQERMNMTPEERRKSLAESTEDVARKDQIFLGVGDVSFSLRDMADGKESGAADMAEDLKSLNTPGEVDDAIKTAIDDMPSGWRMANRKMIHIAQALGENRKAEIAGEEPKFSLKDGSLIKAGTYFSGGGLVEEGLKGIIDPVVAVEYDEKISGVYRNNFGQHIVTADVRDVDPKELVKQIDGEVEYFHASPVCKNYSQAKSNHAEVELDKETAASTAEFINAVKPKVVTIENVKGYKDSEAMKIITDALDANGYTWDADVYNAADYGGYTNRERLIVRAVRDGKLPAKPKKMAHKSGWYEAVADIIPTLTEKKNGVAPWMDIRLKADGIDWRNIDKPLYVMGSAYADGKIPHAFADELLPTLRTKSGDVIVMPDGKVYRAMGRVLARVSGVSDDYKMPFSESLSHTIIGNGIPTQLTEHVIAPLLQNTLRPTTPEDGNTRFSLRGSTPYDKQMEEWKEKNHLDKDAAPMEKPVMQEGENIFDYVNRMVEWTRNQNLWKTAPKQTGFQDALDKWKADNGLSPDAYPPVRPHRENYSTEIGYKEDLEEYNKRKELWKTAPKPKDFDLSVDLEDMNKQLRNIRRAVLNQKNYDQRTVKAVSDLVRKMLNIGWGDGLSRGKVGNLLSAAKNATGANDVKKYLDKAMGILAENYLNRLTTAYDNLIKTKGARADQSGVIKMGSLDAKGQAFMSEYKKAINMDDKSLNTYIANIEEDSAKNEDNVEMNDYRLAGIQAAIMFKQQIGGNDADISELQRQIGELKNKKDATKEDKDLLKSLEKKLFENKFDRITMYENLLNNIQRMVKESKGRAKEIREEIAEHKNEILHRANLDLEGVDSTYYDTTTAKKKLVNNDLQRAVFSSTYTFEQFLKFFGKKAANGEGYLYNYFTKLNQDALDEEQLYNEMNRNALDEKTKELFGKKKFMKLVGIDGKGMKEMDIEVTDYSNKKTGKRTIHLKQGQMLYIYLVNKETDGEMKLRAMGITEEDVAAIEENLDQRVKAMGEWLQDEYLPECQRRYQATHTKYFGAPMKEVENYFPLAINNRARNVKEDVNQDSDAMSQLAGTSTGAIVTRRVNVIPLDIENADAFEVAFNHLQEMEEWSAMLPFRQDINTLLSYTHFRNQVQNMSSVAYGSGKTLWDEFKQTAQIAAGTYKPKVNAGMMDSRIAAAMGGIAVAKISGRLWTAIKQSQSATVFLPECDFTRFVKNGVNPYGSWKWAIENIPDFRKRVENMTYGDVKLRQYLDELEKWHDWTKTISKIGMAPNILVDGITCAVGARSVYETEVNRLTKLGYPKEKAEEKAYYKAVAAYNKTQQSSGGMYLSPMQVDRTYASAALSLFKNANYAYGRMQIEACRGLARTYDFWGGKHKTALIESMTRQIMKEDGLDENTARAIAKATYNRTFRQSIGRLINFATLVPISWALYKVLLYLLTGDDDDKKTDMIEEAVLKGFATSLSDNYVIPFASNILNAGLKVEDGKPTFDPEVFRYQNLYINPATSDLANIYSMIGNQKWYSVANKLGMLGVQSLIGFNPETVGALYQAFAEADYDNGNTAKEWQIGILKAISAPEESIRELYMDELGLKNENIKKIPLAELEKRYAERQINRDNLLSQIFMDAEDFNGYVDKYQQSFEKKIKDKMDKWDEYDKKKADQFFDTTSDPKLKDMIAKKRIKDANAAADEQIAKEGLNQEKKGKEPSEEAYDAVKMSIDVAEDNAISTYNKVLNKRYAALNDEYNDQTDAMKYIFMSNHPNFKAYKDLKSEYTTYGKKLKELKEKLVSADGYDAKQTILKQIRAERDKFYELQSKVR